MMKAVISLLSLFSLLSSLSLLSLSNNFLYLMIVYAPLLAQIYFQFRLGHTFFQIRLKKYLHYMLHTN